MIDHPERKIRKRFNRFFPKKFHFRYLFMGVAGLLILTLVLQLTWNVVVPGLFDLTAITFWQALGLMVLLRLTAGIMGFTRRRPMHARPMYSRSGRYNQPFIACDSHRVI